MKCLACVQAEYEKRFRCVEWWCPECDNHISLEVYEKIEAMQKVIAKLPVDRDGKPFAPGVNGTELFWESAIWPGTIKGGAWYDTEKIRCWIAGCVGTMPLLSPSDCWVSREAAEKAMAPNCNGPQPCGGCPKCEGGAQ